MSTNEKINVYCEADFDAAMMEAIDKRHIDQKAAEAGRTKEKTEEYKMMRNAATLRHSVHIAATALIFLALFRAMSAGLISPILAIPATYICAGYFGWCACKVFGIFKKGAC